MAPTIGALPVLKALEDCGHYSHTVEPFIDQFYQLPGRLVASSSSIDALQRLYVETNPLVTGFSASLLVAALCLIVSEINRNYSQIDRLWSILPNLHVLHLALWARMAGLPHARIDLVAIFSTAWSIRLTYNYWRRGGYQVGSEDYRWEIVKSKIPGIIFFFFNVTFISTIQSVLLFAISGVPAYTILLASRFEPEPRTADYVYLAVQLGLVLSEWVSDGQQQKYQNAKHRYNKDAKLPRGWSQADLDRGFNTSGLWAYSRHPNFLAEQTIWFVLYQWSCYATNSMYSWTLLGSGSLILLFQGSTWLTEAITAGKYPEYAEYQRRVGMFLPKSLTPYKAPSHQPKIIRTSDLAKRQQRKSEKQN
ncbi:hypothetical protein E4U30_000848 [Claviceps sp. LM220 group G6]|nr:hypothetical protein E4U15_001968 [Claviceps sp. LM218 group G6]KAG6089538.1 hypothetical protein E4U31_008124 [Claviceps sp. LM219 group G6]KAG6097196.1 hypothetical protein E4U30_000848 [Claviceps sp. LM220 group G6]KAG6119029.1 hypothetical protein E4U14_006001 [Claviceps sp. LM454 group G7]